MGLVRLVAMDDDGGDWTDGDTSEEIKLNDTYVLQLDISRFADKEIDLGTLRLSFDGKEGYVYAYTINSVG